MNLIHPDQLLIEQSDPEPKGGQHTNGPQPTGVKITHIPTKTVAISRVGRSQFINREIAMDMLESALTHPRFGGLCAREAISGPLRSITRSKGPDMALSRRLMGQSNYGVMNRGMGRGTTPRGVCLEQSVSLSLSAMYKGTRFLWIWV